MSPETTVLVHGSRTLEAARRFAERTGGAQAAGRLIVLEIDHRLSRDLLPDGTAYRTPDDYAGEIDSAQIDDDANRIADHWHELFETDPTECDGVSLAMVVQCELTQLLVPLLKNIWMIERLIERERPTRIVLGDGLSLDRWAAAQVAARFQVQVELLPLDPPDVIDPEWRSTGRSTRGSLRIVVCDAVRAELANRIERSDTRRAAAAQYRGRSVVLSFDAFTLGDPRHAGLCDGAQLELLPLYRRSPASRFIRRYCVKPLYRSAFVRRWRTCAAELARASLFNYHGIALWPALRAWFAKQFTDAFPYFAAEAAAMQRRIRRLRPSLLLTPWVYQGRCALATAVARRMHVPVGVLQTFWCPGSAYPGNLRHHLRVDHFFLWSEISQSWCEHPAAVEAKCHFVAHPHYRRADERSRLFPVDSGRRPLALMTAQYWGPWTSIHAPKDTDDMWPAFVATARACPAVDFVAKIHPNMNAAGHEGPGGAQRLVNALPRPLPPNLRLARLRDDVRALLLQADVVVTYYSTTVIEAALAGKPVILLNLSGKRDFLPEAISAGYAQPVYDSAQLAATVTRVLGDAALRERMDAGRRRFLERAVADGEDAAKVVAAVASGSCRCRGCSPPEVAPRGSGARQVAARVA